MNHDINFLNKLFELEKHITSITHDYSLIITKPNPYFEEINTYPRTEININKFDMIITQNEKNLNAFLNFIDPHKIVISPLPDYNKSRDMIQTNNSKIIIGFIK